MSLTYDQACDLAKKHLSEEPFPHKDYRWKLSNGKQVSDGWYFDYSFESVNDLPPDQWEGFGGAPGFIVSEQGVRVVLWPEFQDRGLAG